MGIAAWDAWGDIHTEPDQEKRIKSAYKAECTPLSVSEEDCTGCFQGSSGRYETSLSKCTCVDFNRRELPCKHMYRLAVELGAFGDKSKAKSDQHARKVPKSERSEATISFVGRLENYTDEVQLEVKEILLQYLYHNKASTYYEDASLVAEPIQDGLLFGTKCYLWFLKKRLNTMKKAEIQAFVQSQGDELPPDCKLAKDMKEWVLQRVGKYGPALFPNCMEVVPSQELLPVALSVYKYLHRKYDESAHQEQYFDGEQMVTIETGLPDDFETGLLNMFGTNPLPEQ